MSGRLTSGATATGADFLLELRCEEIPARMQAAARAELDKLFRAQMTAAGVDVGACSVWSTPRRLALIARGLPLATAAVSEEVKGPRTSAPPQALEGFLRKTGLAQDQLVDRDGVWFAVIDRPGRATADVLAEAIPAIIRAFAWPKSMRWGRDSASSESLRWVRPLSGIVALFGDELVACEVGGIAADRTTRGHRFHSSGDIAVTSAADYAAVLRAAHVIVDQDERAAIIRDGAAKAAADAGLSLIADEGLVIENAGLTEWPVPLLGRFDEAFLEVPPEVIQLTARVNQKYFVVQDAAGKLANAFVCTANIAASDGGAEIVAGNRKVLAARLSDARFFWEQDQKKTLAQHAEKLANITFHEKLGTVADKVERVAKLARWLVEEGIVGPNTVRPELVEGLSSSGDAAIQKDSASTSSAQTVVEDTARTQLADQAELAARLCKADLVTEMVGEFPELQGLMGGYYARAGGLPDAVADAIRDHYKPVGQGDEVPTAPVTVAVSLADKLDTVSQFYSQNMKPTGSKDPFALRRAAMGIIALCKANSLRLSLIMSSMRNLLGDKPSVAVEESQSRKAAAVGMVMEEMGHEAAMGLLKGWLPTIKDADQENRIRDALSRVMLASLPVAAEVRDFVIERLEIAERDSGVRPDIIRAARSYDGAIEDDLVRLLARVKALQAFMATEDGANLLAGYKRAANLLKQAGQDLSSNARHAELVSASTAGPWTLKQVQGDERLGIADASLFEALDAATPAALEAVAEERFTDAMAALASLRAPIDAFFDGVMVNDPDPEIRAFRLGLLARFTGAVHGVADFSKIEG